MKYIFGNWKMYLDLEASNKFATDLAGVDFDVEKISVSIFPSALALSSVAKSVCESQISVGAQDVYWIPDGAYTGAVSALMFRTAGCKYALVGHSERRHIFGETDGDVRKKIEACLDSGLIPVVCIGETKEEKDSGQREYRLKKQIMKAFDGLKLNGGDIIVAYEPVWAIGTGDACNPADADDVHGWIKQEVRKYVEKEIPVLYGGSVNENNFGSYLQYDTIDGILVGSASTKVEPFSTMIKYV